jgi:hypothetical protein
MKHWTVTVGKSTVFGFPSPQKAAEFAELLKYVVIAKKSDISGEERWKQVSAGRICIEEIDIEMFPVEPPEEAFNEHIHSTLQ